jgi:hypothetical protein
LAARRTGGGDDDRHGVADRRRFAQPATDVETVNVGQLRIEQDQVRSRRQGAIDGLLPGKGPKDGKTLRRQHALDRARRPFLVVCDQHQGRTQSTFQYRNL